MEELAIFGGKPVRENKIFYGRQYIDQYGVDAIMIGRASFGRPWIFKEVKHYIETGKEQCEKALAEIGGNR